MDESLEESKKRSDHLKNLFETLKQLRLQYGFRAETLVPDIVFIGLVDDCIDAGQTALELIKSPRPYRAYSMVRVAFEASQRLLPLATSSDYIRLGTRAWLYYKQKDGIIRGIDKDSIGPAAEQILNTWANYYPSAHQIALEELAVLNNQKGPDNFLGRNLAEVTTESYLILAQERGSSASSDSAEINRKFYATLSRDTHACLRLDLSELRVDSDGFIEVKERPRDPKEVARNVIVGLGAIFTETIAAIKYRISKRRQANATHLITTLGESHTDLLDGYFNDLGKYLVLQGFGGESVFPDVPIGRIAELQDGTLSTSLVVGFGTEAKMATFDFKGHARQAMLAIISEEFPDVIISNEQNTLHYIDLPKPISVIIKAELGCEKQTGTESFVPFIVTQVTRTNLGA
jgi:hypothetical protein